MEIIFLVAHCIVFVCGYKCGERKNRTTDHPIGFESDKEYFDKVFRRENPEFFKEDTTPIYTELDIKRMTGMND